MTGTIFDKLDQRFRFPELVQNRFGDVEVTAFISCSNVVNTTGSALIHDSQNRSTVIININPITNVLSVTINRNGLVVQGVAKHQRKKFFRELPWPIIVPG